MNEQAPTGVFRINNTVAIYPVDIILPTYNQKYQKLVNSKTEIKDTSVVITQDVVDVPVSNAKSQALANLATIRFEKQSSGMKYQNTIIATDTSSQALLNGAYNLALHDSTTTIQFKSQNGWMTITAEQIIQLAIGVGKFIQQCFSVEKIHSDRIMAMSTTEQVIDYVDTKIQNGWPE